MRNDPLVPHTVMADGIAKITLFLFPGATLAVVTRAMNTCFGDGFITDRSVRHTHKVLSRLKHTKGQVGDDSTEKEKAKALGIFAFG